MAFGAALSFIILPTAGALLGVAATVVIITPLDVYVDGMTDKEAEQQANEKK